MNPLLRALFDTGLSNTLIATLLALVALVISWTCRRRPAIVHAAWLIVLIKLISPALFTPTDIETLDFASVSPALPQTSAPANASIAPSLAVETAVREAAPTPVEFTPPASPPADTLVVSEAAVAPTARQHLRQTTLPWPASFPPHPVAPPKTAAGVGLVGETASEEPTSRGGNDGSLFNTVTQALTTVTEWLSNFAPAIAAVWLLGSLSWFVLAGYRIWQMRRLLARAAPATVEIDALIAAVAAELGLRHAPPARLVSASISPFVWIAARWPVVVLPQGLWRDLNGDQQRMLIAHELAHLARRDHWVCFLELMVVGLFWWLPIAWVARRQVSIAAESCCDALVVRKFPEMAHTYAGALLAAVEFLEEARPNRPVLGMPLGEAQLIRRRLEMILKGQTNQRFTWFLKGALVVAALGVLPLSIITLEAGESGPATGKEQTASTDPSENVKPAGALNPTNLPNGLEIRSSQAASSQLAVSTIEFNDAEIKKRLQKRTPLQVTERPLLDVLKFLSDIADVNLVVDGAVRETCREMTVTQTIERPITVASALNIVLKPNGLRYEVVDEVVRVYDPAQSLSYRDDAEFNVYLPSVSKALSMPKPFVAGSSDAAVEARLREIENKLKLAPTRMPLSAPPDVSVPAPGSVHPGAIPLLHPVPATGPQPFTKPLPSSKDVLVPTLPGVKVAAPLSTLGPRPFAKPLPATKDVLVAPPATSLPGAIPIVTPLPAPGPQPFTKPLPAPASVKKSSANAEKPEQQLAAEFSPRDALTVTAVENGKQGKSRTGIGGQEGKFATASPDNRRFRPGDGLHLELTHNRKQIAR